MAKAKTSPPVPSDKPVKAPRKKSPKNAGDTPVIATEEMFARIREDYIDQFDEEMELQLGEIEEGGGSDHEHGDTSAE